jgi:hypothetical protein
MKLSSLYSEDGEYVSMGRVLLWIMFGICCYFWFCRSIADFPPTVLDITVSLLLYNFGKKGVDVFNSYFQMKTATSKGA